MPWVSKLQRGDAPGLGSLQHMHLSPIQGRSLSALALCVHAQPCPTLQSHGLSPPGLSFHGVFQARILEWVAISYSRESSRFRDQTCVSCVSCIGRQILYRCAIWEVPKGLFKSPLGCIYQIYQLCCLFLSYFLFLYF